jgi:hypothetical protein
VTGGGAKVATEVIVHVRADGASLDDGTPITGALAERLVPRSDTRAMIHDAESHPTDVSGKAERGAVRLTTRDVVDEVEPARLAAGANRSRATKEPAHAERRRRARAMRKCKTCHRRRHREGSR